MIMIIIIIISTRQTKSTMSSINEQYHTHTRNLLFAMQLHSLTYAWACYVLMLPIEWLHQF